MHQKWIRIGLLLLLAAAAVAVLVSIYSRFETDEAPEAELLSPNISRRSTDFDYSEYKLGRLVFRVMSRSHALDSQGTEQLEDVDLVIHDEEGSASDSISGNNAVYDVEKKTVNFFGAVRIDLKDGTVVTCERVFADLGKQEIRIEEAFEFSREQAKGTGGSLVYRISQRLLEVDNSFQIKTDTESGETFQAEAERGVFYASQSRVTLVGSSRLIGLGYTLQADQIRLEMTPEQGLKQVVANGQSRLVGPERTFEGDQIIAGFDPVRGSLTDFRIVGPVDGASAGRASYRQRSEQGDYNLRAERIVFFPVPGSADNWSLAISGFKAVNNVLLTAPVLGVDRATCGFLDAEFGPQEALKRLEFRTNVVLKRRVEKEQRHLEAETLVVDIDDLGQVKGLVARRDVVLRTENEGTVQRLFSAKSDVQVDFAEGRPVRMSGRGGCVFEAKQEGEEVRTRAPLVTAEFEDGIVSQVSTRGGTETDYRQEDERINTKSVSGQLIFDAGTLSEVQQSRDFELRGTAGIGTYQLQGENASFDPKSQTTRVVGRKPPKLTVWGNDEAQAVLSETVAKRFEINRNAETMVAIGDVRTLVTRQLNPITINAGSMRVEGDWVHYSRNPEILEGANRISGDKVRYNPDLQRLVVQGKVRSLMVGVSDQGPGEATITANLLRFDQEANKARYEGDVKAETEDMVLTARFLELLFEVVSGENRSTVKEVNAWGGVSIREPGREATGDRALYYPLEKKVSITGDQAELMDDQQGKAFGRRLTYFLGEERLTIEGLPNRER